MAPETSRHEPRRTPPQLRSRAGRAPARPAGRSGDLPALGRRPGAPLRVGRRADRHSGRGLTGACAVAASRGPARLVTNLVAPLAAVLDRDLYEIASFRLRCEHAVVASLPG